MTRLDLFEKLDVINDAFVAQAEISPELLTATTLSTRSKKSHSPDFWNSPWFVAVICATVALFVLGGIIWAGNRPDTPMVAGTQENSQDMLYETEASTEADTEAVTHAETQTAQETEEQATQIDTAPETQADTSNEVTFEANEDGLYIIMEEPYVWESFTPSATQLIQQIDVELPEGVTMKRTAVYHQAWVKGVEQDMYIVEARELTDPNGNRSIHLITRDPYNIEEELHTYAIDIGNNSHWGLVQASSEFFLYYIEDYRTRNFDVRMIQLYLGNIDATSGERLDSIGLRPLFQPNDMTLLYASASENPSSNLVRRKMWNSTIQRSYDRTSSTFRMIADDFFGESAFFEEDDVTTIGWERLQKFLYCQFREDIVPPTQEDMPSTPDAPPVDSSDNTEEQTVSNIEPIT